MKNLKEKGITLIALVITIIVLLILAGVTLSLIWNGGIIDKSQKAVNEYSKAEEKEYEILDDVQTKFEALMEKEKDEWDGTIATGFENSSEENAGTKENPYTIKTAEQLAYFASQVNGGNDYTGKYIKLRANIELNPGKWTKDENGNVTFTSDAEQWIPIGTNSKPFKGTFDGNTHTISGLYIDKTNSYQGLFGENMGTIKNITIDNGYIKGENNIAMVCGHSNNAMFKNIIIKNGNVTGKTNVGGIVGTQIDSDIYESINNSNVYGEGTGIGGISGIFTGGTISKCGNKGNITIAGEKNWGAGGIAGRMGTTTNDSLIELSYNIGNVIAQDTSYQNAGIVGNASTRAIGIFINISNCYNWGNNVSAGIVSWARSVTITNCYNVGITTNGGIIESFADNTVVKNNYWLDSCGALWGVRNSVDGAKTNENAQPLNEDSLRNIYSTLGSEFKQNLNGYPILSWQ